jgi:ABC-type microcin C transport system permease subunit YejE
MSFRGIIRKIVLLGMKHEADDIIDYIAIRASLLISVLTGALLTILMSRVVGPWAGAAMGLGTYALSMRICALVFFGSQHPR